MELLPLGFIGWFFTLLCGAALLAGAALIFQLTQSGSIEKRYLSYSIWNDVGLGLIWGFGLAGGIGILNLLPWSRWLLDLFCWALIVLILLSAFGRLHAIRDSDREAWRGNRLMAIAGAMLVVLPIVAMCAATIYTLRNLPPQHALTGR